MQDQLKSSSVLANQNGTVNSRNYFYPFGGNRGGAAFSALATKRFTGQYHEQGLPGGEGLSYYGARWYDAQLGRFASPDTVVPDPKNPQDLNRYAYTLNNPLRYIDPTGHGSMCTADPYDPGCTATAQQEQSKFLYYVQSVNYYQGNSWDDLPAGDRFILTRNGVTAGMYGDCCGNAKVQTGWRDPATVAAGAVGIGKAAPVIVKVASSYIAPLAFEGIRRAGDATQWIQEQIWPTENQTVTMYRGTAYANDAEAMTEGVLESHAQRVGVEPNFLNQNFLTRMWHSLTSSTPPSQYVSITSEPHVAARFGEVYTFEVYRNAIYRAWWNPFGEAEYLAPGGTEIFNVRLWSGK